MARRSRLFPLGPVVLGCLWCAAFAPPVSASLSNDDARDALSSGVGETAHAAQSARDAMLVFALHAETQEQSGRTERVYGAKVGLLFLDGSWRVIAEGRSPAYSPDGRVIAISHKQLRPRGAY